MKQSALALLLFSAYSLQAALPTDEAGAIAYLSERGVTITKNAEGHAVNLKALGKPALAAEEYALIGKLTSEEIVRPSLQPSPLNFTRHETSRRTAS